MLTQENGHIINEKKRDRQTDIGCKTMSAMSTMLDPQIFTEERENHLEN